MRNYAVIAVVLALGFLIWAIAIRSQEPVGIRPSSIQGEQYVGQPLVADYENAQFGFSLKMPDGFSPLQLPEDETGAHTLVLQNSAGEGIQIRISPYVDVKTITADDITIAIPDMSISDPEVVTIGPEYTGVAFVSDNDAFEGASREVWFVYKGNLYQISTYKRLDTLLQAIFATWQFFE
jgi:hypothetical protein